MSSLRRGGAAEFQRVRENAGQHRAFDLARHLRQVLADHFPHDRRGAGERFDADVDGALGLEPAHQLVVVDDLADVGVVDVGRQFRGIVRVDDHDRCVCGNLGDDLGLVELPALQHEQRFGIGLAQKHGLRLHALDLVEIPGPDDRRSCAVGIGRFMAKNESCHEAVLLRAREFAGLIGAQAVVVTHSDCALAPVHHPTQGLMSFKVLRERLMMRLQHRAGHRSQVAKRVFTVSIAGKICFCLGPQASAPNEGQDRGEM